MNRHTCCFIGHRRINTATFSKTKLEDVLLLLIEEGITDFIFGDHSQFDEICYETITNIKRKFPEIKRIKFRKDYPEISESVKKYFLEGYEDNICPPGVGNAGRASYTERNKAMIDASDVCVFYYDVDYQPTRRKDSNKSICDYQPKSGTRIAYEFAKSRKKRIINIYGL